MTLKFTNVTVDVISTNPTYGEKYLTIVKNVTGEFEKNQLIAIMGPSGCGKTSFMAALAGQIQKGSKTSGTITFDGKERDYRSFLTILGFIDQKDMVYPTLTLFETVKYAIGFRLKNIPPNIDKYIDDLLHSLNLQGSRLNQMHRLSGGQKRRAMLAIEIASDPQIILADEPISSLDYTTALEIVKLLRSLADQGKIVAISLHQPSEAIFEMFDKLMLMARAQVVYFGKPSDCRQYIIDNGVEVDDSIPFTNFISDMVVSEDEFGGRSNPNIKAIKNIINDRNGDYTPDYSSIVKCNDAIRDYRINLKHIMLIFARKVTITLRDMTGIYKSIGKTLIVSGALYLMHSNGISAFRRAHELGQKNDMSSLLGESSENDALKDLYEKQFDAIAHIYSLIYYVVFFASIVIGTTSSSFFDNIEIIKREIAIESYSATSHVFGYYLYHVTRVILTLIPFTGIFLATTRTAIDSTVIIIHVIGTMVIVPIGFAIGSLSKNRKIVLAAVSILSLPLSISSDLSYMLAMAIFEFIDADFLRYIAATLDFMRVLSPFHTLTNFYLIFVDNMFSLLPEIIEKYPESIVRYYFEQFQMQFAGLRLMGAMPIIYVSLISKISLFVGMSLLVWLFVLYRQSNILMPTVRMQLSK